MIELIAIIAVTAIALTFFSDATRYTLKTAKMVAPRKRETIRVAEHH